MNFDRLFAQERFLDIDFSAYLLGAGFLAWLLIPGLGVFLLWVAIILWMLAPYFSWRRSVATSLEAHMARTSFHFRPGELATPPWKPPEVFLSVIVPAFNEEYRLPQMLDETLTYLEARAAANAYFTYEVLVVDDGSFDGTYAAALGARRPASLSSHCELRALQLSRNRGKGFAVRAGMLVARGRLLLMADADGATSIRDLERLERSLAGGRGGGPARSGVYGDDGVHIAFGSRHHLQDEARAKRSFILNVLMVGFDCVVWLLLGGRIHDTQCGFKLFRAEVGKHIFASLHLHRWAFDIEIAVLARLMGERIAEVPVTWVEMPGSKLSPVTSAVSMLRDIVATQVFYWVGAWQPAVVAPSAGDRSSMFDYLTASARRNMLDMFS